MGVALFWKSVVRRKGSLLLLLVLLVLASFGFMLRAVEYLAVSREIDRIAGEYKMIGTLSSSSEFVTEGIPLVEASPYVEFVNITGFCPVVLSDVYNVDVDGITSWYFQNDISISDILVWAKVTEKKKTVVPDVYEYDLRVSERVYGYPEYTEPERLVRVTLGGEEGQESLEMEVGKTYLIKACYDIDKAANPYGEGFYFQLKELENGVWFLEGEPDSGTALRYIGEYEILQERNRHAMLALTTADMSALPRVQESFQDFYLESGRWLDHEDETEGRMVCVVAKEFAEMRGLRVGDTLSMTLQNARLPLYGYVMPPYEDPWETCEKLEAEFEIVGIYGRLYEGAVNMPGWSPLSSHANEFYIPDSCMPEHYVDQEEGGVWQPNFSFVLKSPEMKDAFLQEAEGGLKELGMSVSFMENNWDAFYASAQGIRQGAFYSFLVFTAVLAVALGAVVFLYTWQRKKETAIARALGIPAGRAAFCACLPLLLVSAAGILAGAGLAWCYGLEQANKTLAVLEEAESVTLPAFWFAGICLSVWLFLALAALAGTAVYVRRPVLEILHGSPVRRKNTTGRGKTPVEDTDKKVVIPSEGKDEKTTVLPKGAQRETGIPLPEAVDAGKRKLHVAGIRFVGRHLRRFSLRSVFALLAAAAFVTASCWLCHSIQEGEAEADRLYRSTKVEAEILKQDAGVYVDGHGGAFISSTVVESLEATGFIRDSHLEASAECRVKKEDGSTGLKKSYVMGTADVEKFLSRSWNEMEVHYGDGYGEELFSVDYRETDEGGSPNTLPAVILPEDLWEKWELEPGEMLMVTNSDGKLSLPAAAGGFYTGESTGLMSGTILAPLSFLELLEDDLYYLTAQFTLEPERNRELEAFREQGAGIIEAPGAGLQGMSMMIWDNQLKQTVEPMEKNIILMKILYPLANAVSFLASAGLSVLFVFQRRREAAILRILGVGALQTRSILVLELAAINAVGMIAGACMTMILTDIRGLYAMPLAAGCYFLGCLLGMCAGAVWVTSGRPLELLQGREG